jgi:hypothetical protein
MVFGDVGTGKSTTLNFMLSRYANILQPQHKIFFEENKKELIFKSKAQGESVTKNI